MASALIRKLLPCSGLIGVDCTLVRRLSFLPRFLPIMKMNSLWNSNPPVPQGHHHRQLMNYAVPFHQLLQHRWNSTVPSNEEVLEEVNKDINTLQPNKVFAVVHIGGRQFKITANDLVVINRIPADIGAEIYLEKVLLAGSENFTLIGRPILSEDVVRVKATVTEHSKTAKVIVFKKKRRKNYKRKKGHRQDVTTLRINEIKLLSTLK